MRVLGILILNFFAFHVFATDFSYQISPGWSAPRRLDLLEFQVAFQSKGFFALNLKNAGHLDWIPVDQIYATSDLRQIIFLKLGVQIRDKKQERVFIKGAKGTLYHDRTRDGEPFALFLQNFATSEMEDLLGILPTGRQKKASARFSILPTAYADQIARSNENGSSIVSSGSLVAAEAASTCVGAAWDGAKGAADSMWQGAKQLLTDPWAFWDSVSSKFDEFKALLSQLNTEMSELIEALARIDRETALIMVCQIAGQATFSALLMAGGVGATQGVVQAVKLISQIKMIREMLTMLSRLRSLGKVNVGSIREVISGAVACASH